MRSWPLPLQPRFIVFTAAVLMTVALAVALFFSPSIYLAIPLVLGAALTTVGTVDLIQTRHAVLRNYPLTAHIRFILEEIRPEIRQYFLESEKEARRFPATSARSSINAPSRHWTSGRLVPRTTFMPAASSG